MTTKPLLGEQCYHCDNHFLCMHKPSMYYLGLLIDYCNPKYTGTVTVQARRCIDCLDCELWEYLGPRVVTKAHLKANKAGLLAWINQTFNATFTRIVID